MKHLFAFFKNTSLFVIFISLCISSGFAQINLDSGLVAYYPFDGNTKDSIGDNDGLLLNGVSLVSDRFGMPNLAYYLDGTDQHILIPHDPIFNSYPFSISFWFYKEDFMIEDSPDMVDREGLLWKRHNTGNIDYGYVFSIGEQGAPFRIVFSTAADKISNPEEITPQTWYLITGVATGSDLKLYLGCNLIGFKSINGFFTPNSEPIIIGGIPFDGSSNLFPSRFFHGRIDDLRFYNRALTEKEITELYLDGGNEENCITGIDDEEWDDLQVYPNPVKENLIVEIPENNRSSGNLTLFDSFGKTVFQGKTTLGERQVIISIENLPEGIYHLVLHSDGLMARRKVLIQR